MASRPLRLLRRLTLAEHGIAGEDRWAARGRTWALCDGASESYDGAGWAAYLARQLALTPRLEAALELARRRYVQNLQVGEGVPWIVELGALRGSWSTALRLRLSPGRTAVEVLALGDTVFFLRDGLKTVASFPLDDADAFGSRPELLADRAEGDGTLVEAGPMASAVLPHRAVYDLRRLRRPRLVLATDALAQRILRAEGVERVGIWTFLGRCSPAEFRSWARTEMDAGALKRDDLTFLELAP